MESFAAGDESAFRMVYNLAAPRIFRMLMRLSREPALAEDITQETLLRMYSAAKAFLPGAKVLPWAYTIARRLFIDRVHDRRNEQAIAGALAAYRSAHSEVSVDEELAARRTASAVDALLERLPRRQAEAFRLVKQEGLSLAEASARLGDTNLAIRLRTHRACQTIRAELKQHGDLC